MVNSRPFNAVPFGEGTEKGRARGRIPRAGTKKCKSNYPNPHRHSARINRT